jgi:nicotinamidase-related amidase
VPFADSIDYLKRLKLDRVLVCGLQTENCCLTAGFALFDAGLQPTLLTDLTVGSSLDRSAEEEAKEKRRPGQIAQLQAEQARADQ